MRCVCLAQSSPEHWWKFEVSGKGTLKLVDCQKEIGAIVNSPQHAGKFRREISALTERVIT